MQISEENNEKGERISHISGSKFTEKIVLLKKVLFPFSYSFNLEGKWWHRLIKVFYAILMFIVLFVNYHTCLYDGNTRNRLFCQGGDIMPSKSVSSWCLNKYPPHIEQDWIRMFIYSVIAYYVLQIIYYKVILYVIFGSKKFQ